LPTMKLTKMAHEYDIERGNLDISSFFPGNMQPRSCLHIAHSL